MARSKEEILSDLLAATREKVNKTTVMYRANLSHPQLMGHSTYLIEKQMIIRQDGLYVASEKGRVYVDAYQKMLEIIANQFMSWNWLYVKSIRIESMQVSPFLNSLSCCASIFRYCFLRSTIEGRYCSGLPTSISNDANKSHISR